MILSEKIRRNIACARKLFKLDPICVFIVAVSHHLSDAEGGMDDLVPDVKAHSFNRCLFGCNTLLGSFAFFLELL